MGYTSFQRSFTFTRGKLWKIVENATDVMNFHEERRCLRFGS